LWKPFKPVLFYDLENPALRVNFDRKSIDFSAKAIYFMMKKVCFTVRPIHFMIKRIDFAAQKDCSKARPGGKMQCKFFNLSELG
jgi:hypothetical protein